MRSWIRSPHQLSLDFSQTRHLLPVGRGERFGKELRGDEQEVSWASNAKA
jgi:hypothetical protein